jgi:carboxylesterase type B
VRYYGVGKKLDGLSTGRICPQNDAGGFSGAGLNVSAAEGGGIPAFLQSLGGLDQEKNEDCLTINVWTKRSSTAEKLKPVLVWIYGGGFATGNSNSSAYSGQYWADQEDVVFVNFNYRLGVFGFSGAPGLTQNVGLLDQRMAVEWVRDNAAAFGGDASRIILFGESAGAASTDYYTYAWASDPIIAGSIHESGQANSFGNKAADQQASRWYTLSTSLGCGNLTTSTADAVVQCMRDPTKVPTAAITKNSVGNGPLSVILAQFGPTIDDVTVFSNYTQRVVDGQFSHTPALVGSNDNEAGIFILIFALFGVQQSQAAWDALTESVFTCPANSAAYARYLHNVPVWRYRYFPAFPNIQIPTSVGRAYHLSEVFPLFGTDIDVSGQARTAEEADVGGYLRRAWAAFAHDPKSALGQGEFGWPMYSPDVNGTEGLVLLGKDNSSTPQFSARGVYDGPACSLFYGGLAGF